MDVSGKGKFHLILFNDLLIHIPSEKMKKRSNLVHSQFHCPPALAWIEETKVPTILHFSPYHFISFHLSRWSPFDIYLSRIHRLLSSQRPRQSIRSHVRQRRRGRFGLINSRLCSCQRTHSLMEQTRRHAIFAQKLYEEVFIYLIDF